MQDILQNLYMYVFVHFFTVLVKDVFAYMCEEYIMIDLTIVWNSLNTPRLLEYPHII